MAIEFKPNLGDGVKSADVAALHVAAGDKVEEGQIVMELETDKAVLEIAITQAGTIEKLLVKKGDTVNVGAAVLMLEPSMNAVKAAPAGSAKTPLSKELESVLTVDQGAASASSANRNGGAQGAIAKVMGSTATKAAPSESSGRDLPLPAGPATRRLARELGLSLANISGSGSGGRITLEDVARAAAGSSGGGSRVVEPPLPDFAKYGEVERVAFSKLQKTSANNLSLAWQIIPHVTQHDLSDITETEALRKRFVENAAKGAPKVTMTVLAMKAVVACLKEFPNFNSSFDSAKGEIVQKKYFNIGIAVDTPNGLVVPVVKHVDQKSILELAAELTELATKARDRKLQLADMQGGTFTITNLGGIGGTSFTPIVNYPEVAILGMSRSQKQLQLVDGHVTERLMLPLSLSYDHRVVNGADAARFTVKLCNMLSSAFSMLIGG